MTNQPFASVIASAAEVSEGLITHVGARNVATTGQRGTDHRFKLTQATTATAATAATSSSADFPPPQELS
ncbi:hypothetical protein [Duganella phyllosphaerae]|uniref:Uncharacterized protein n=1 Tax=Duganella phyllosphaerae TaxID=762836 RepID=A0A1E7X6B1_9BURK|nr:hypothetical protein [Duganella phyllosphaerae]OFA08563.1 hypothetical protein DUPY_06920 [Duganella phyllosphaerae]